LGKKILKLRIWGKNKKGKTIFSFLIFPTPFFFPRSPLPASPQPKNFLGEKYYGCGKAVKGLLEKKMRGWGK